MIPINAFLVALVLCQVLSVHEVLGNPDAKRLYDDLLSNYNRLIRPVSNNNDTVLVKLGLRLSQLIDLVCKTKRADVSGALASRNLNTSAFAESQGSNSDNERLARACKYDKLDAISF